MILLLTGKYLRHYLDIMNPHEKKLKVWINQVGRNGINGSIPPPVLVPVARPLTTARAAATATNVARVLNIEDSDYHKTSSLSEEEDDDEAWENDNTTKKKAKKKPTTTKKTGKKLTAITDEQRIQFRQLDRPISIMVAWDKPKKYL